MRLFIDAFFVGCLLLDYAFLLEGERYSNRQRRKESAMYVPDINEVKEKMTGLETAGVVTQWELPYENLLTRLSAAIFFTEVTDESQLEALSSAFSNYDHFLVQTNTKKEDAHTLSRMSYRMTFSQEAIESYQEKCANENTH